MNAVPRNHDSVFDGKYFTGDGCKRDVQRMLGAGCLLLFLAATSERQAALYRTAEILWRDTIAKNPASWMAHMNLGHALVADGKLAEAEQNYRIAAELAPEEADPHYSIATVEAQWQHYAPAALEYEKAVRLNPHVAVMYLDMGHSLQQLHRLDEAIAAYKTAVSLQPQWARARVVLAEALLAAGKTAEAREQYQQALRIEQGASAAH